MNTTFNFLRMFGFVGFLTTMVESGGLADNNSRSSLLMLS